MELISLLCLMFPWVGVTSAQEIKVVNVPEDEDALLPCTLNSGQRIDKFDWRKDNGEDEMIDVFLYEGGSYYSHGRTWPPNSQFKSRVEFFKEELKSGNASIRIKTAQLADNGTYTCGLVERHRPVHIRLNVDGVLKYRPNVTGAARVPYIQTLDDQTTWRLLECRVKGVPKPEVEWINSAGEKLAKHIPESEDEQHSPVALKLTVTKSDNYTCVATQRGIYHQTNNTLPVRFQEPSNTWKIISGVLGAVLLAGAFVCIIKCCKKKANPTQEELL